MPAAVNALAVRSEVDAVLGSELFSQAPSLAQFLSYVCTKSLEGHADQIKEYNIAIEALGRPAEFDQKRDSIVRVEAHRLRKRLLQYYQGEGASHTLQIVIPSGQYVPLFVERDANPILQNLSLPAPTSLSEPIKDNGAALFRVPQYAFPAGLLAPGPKRRTAFWLLGLAIVLLGAVFILSRLTTTRGATAGGPAGLTVPAPQEGDQIRILAGASTSFVDRYGNIWQADRYYRGGIVLPTIAGSRILRSRDSALFQTRREGIFGYDIPLKAGTYELRLFFAETVFGEENIACGGESSRLITITANDKPLVTSLDVVADAHGSSTADVKVFKDISPAADGYLHLNFSYTKESAFVNAIAIQPGLPGRLNPIRIVSRDISVTSKGGEAWNADRYFTGGQTVLRSGNAVTSPDPELYRGERYGHFDYVIPVAPGRYTVTLKFVESWFGPGKPGGGGEGSRVFDVYYNGVALLRHFDIFKQAGGADRALDKTFRGLQPNSQGKLLLSFVPVQNYACLNALEVMDEGQ